MNQKLNILFVYPTMFHPQRGGVERVTDILVREFSNRGHSVFYLNNKRHDELMDYDYPARLDFFPFEDYRDHRNKQFYVDYLNRNKIDIIINQCGAFGDSSLYCHREGTKAKVISAVHSNPALNYNHLFHEISQLRDGSFIEIVKRIARVLIYPKIKKDYYKRLQRHYTWLSANEQTDKIVLLSEAFLPTFMKFVGKTLINKPIVIANPTPYPIERNLPKEKILLFVGRLAQGEKRPDRVLDIWEKVSKRHPDWKCILVGDGPERGRLERKAKKMSNIQFVGYQNPESYYRKASILCMTSNFEGFPMVLAEQMSKGGVPMAFDSFDSVHDIIKDSRQLVKPFSISEYCDKLELIMDSPAVFEELQEKGYQSAEKLSLTNIVDKWESVFEELCSGCR